MTLLTTLQAVAKNIGIEPPTAIDDDAGTVLLVQFINEAGDEIERRVDWGALRKSMVATGTGAAALFSLPPEFSRLAQGVSATAQGRPVRGSLTASEWAALPLVEGTPRYFYLSAGHVSFYPFLPVGDTATVQYLSRNWASNDASDIRRMVLAGDHAHFPEELLESGAVWRWRRHEGKDFADYLAEFEAKLADLSRFDGGVRAP